MWSSGGVLTYLIPTTYDFTLTDLPLHPCLDLLQVRFTLLRRYIL